MLQKNLKSSAETLANILNQPLHIPGIAENVTFLQAMKTFSSEPIFHSNLGKLLRIFASNPGPTKALITELELIARDLTPN